MVFLIELGCYVCTNSEIRKTEKKKEKMKKKDGEKMKKLKIVFSTSSNDNIQAKWKKKWAKTNAKQNKYAEVLKLLGKLTGRPQQYRKNAFT